LKLRHQFATSDDEKASSRDFGKDERNRPDQIFLPFMPCQMSDVDHDVLILSDVKFSNEMVFGGRRKSFRIDTAVNHKDTLCRDTIRHQNIFDLMRNCNVIVGHKTVFEAT